MSQKLIYLTDSRWTDVVNDMVIDYKCTKEQLCEALSYDRKMRQRVVQYSFPFIPDVRNTDLIQCSNAYVEAQYEKMESLYSKWWRKKEQIREIAEMAKEENYMRKYLAEQENVASVQLALRLRKEEECKKRKLAKLKALLKVGSEKDERRKRLRRKLG